MKDSLDIWIKRMLIDKSNPFEIEMKFNDTDELESYFGKSCNLDSVLRGFGKNAEIKRFSKKLRGLSPSFSFQKLMAVTLSEFNNGYVTNDAAFALGVLTAEAIKDDDLFLLNDDLNESSCILDLLSQIRLNPDPNDKDWSYGFYSDRESEKLGLSMAEYEFGLRLFDTLSEDQLLEAFKYKNKSSFKKYSYFLYKEAIESCDYEFNSDDIDILLEVNLSISSLIHLYYHSDYENLNNVFKIIADKINNEEITPSNARKVISNWESFYEILNKAPTLRSCPSFVACAGLESLIKRGIGLNSFDMFSVSRGRSDKYDLNVIDALEQLPVSIKEEVFLTYVSKNIDSNSNQTRTTDSIIDFYIDNSDSRYQELWKELKCLKDSIETFKLSSINEITLAYWISRSKLPSNSLYEFVPVDSDDWWDYGSKTLPNVIEIISSDSIENEINDSEFLRLSKLAIKNSYYSVLVENSERLCLASHSYCSLGEIEDLYLEALKELSESQLSSLSDNVKYAALLLMLPRDIGLAKRIAVNLPDSIKLVGDYESGYPSDSLKANNKEVLIRNIEKISRAIKQESTSLLSANGSNIFDIFSEIIGVQKREVSNETMLCSISIDKCINAGIVDYSKAVSFVKLGEGDAELSYDFDCERRFTIESFIHSHFPRLKAQYSFLQIEAIYNYLHSKGLHIDSINNRTCEGIFKKHDTLYVFGEFDWLSIFHLVMSEIEFETKKLVILTSRIIEDDGQVCHDSYNFEIEETKIVLTSEIVDIILFVRNALDLDVIRNPMNSVGKSPFQMACSRILPEISHEGILINSN